MKSKIDRVIRQAVQSIPKKTQEAAMLSERKNSLETPKTVKLVVPKKSIFDDHKLPMKISLIFFSNRENKNKN